ncbi:hypothetical protein SAMN05216418_0171 [Microbacterium enclense]|uniref:Uncharacterized protein n=2 Tax=Microbacterium enclense TaxID=993073 RepID=A0A1G6RNZ9_9MICO|nr:hypothetical protein AS029_16465 [Microbacterium enclense]SDD06151.1 hypothetical protein SAMN05216418_0171 [Microbacterium enclense]
MASMSDSTERDAEPELVDRLRVIEAQPLDTRADAYAAVHEELARRLESAPTDTSTAPRA